MSEIYEGEANSSWDRKQDAIVRSRQPKPLPGLPATLEKLLAMPVWRGSAVEERDGFLVIRHPEGAVMRLVADVFERRAQEKEARRAELAAVEARRAAKRALKAAGSTGMTRHQNAQ